jgi:hypothetical protein
MNQETELTAASLSMSPVQTADERVLVRCPHCASTQFFGRRRITSMGWVLYGAALVNVLLSIPMMFIFIGFFTMFLTPILALIGFYGCRAHVNTCARCKRDF